MFSASAVNHLERSGRHSFAWAGSQADSRSTTTSTQDTEAPSDDVSSITMPSLPSVPTVTTGTTRNSSSRRRKDLTHEERLQVLHFLLQHLRLTKRLKNGTLAMARAKFGVSIATCKRILQRFHDNNGDISSARSNSGRAKKRSPEDYAAAFRAVPLTERKNLRALAEASGIPKSNLRRAILDGIIKVKNSVIRPALTADNRRDRMRFVLSHIDHNGMMNDFSNYIHVDEKLFYLTKTQQKYYLLPGEEAPHRTCKSKRFITKVMFLAAVARPHFCTRTRTWFNGLIGVWPFVEKVPALRNSKNRPKGTLVTKPLASVNSDAYQKMMLEKVLPAIKERWPTSNRVPLVINEDNCRVHTPATRILLERKANEDFALDISVKPQPANSPDFNVLDLGFFHSIQSLKERENPRTIDDLITAVETAYWKQPRQTIDNVFISLQGAMIASLSVDGSNSYKMPHMKKDKLRRLGQLPRALKCPPLLIARAREVLDDPLALNPVLDGATEKI